MKLCNSVDRITPPRPVSTTSPVTGHITFSHFASVVGRNIWKRSIFENASIQEFHDIERGLNHAKVVAEAVRLGHGDISLFQCADDAVFTLDLMRCLGEKFAGRLFSENIVSAVIGRQIVSGI